MDLGSILKTIAANYGPVGLCFALLIGALYWKDKKLAEESAARIADASAYTKTLLVMQEKLLGAVDALEKLYNEQREREHERLRSRSR